MDLYQKLYDKYYFPFFEGVIKKRETAKIYTTSIESQWKSRKELQENQLAQFYNLLTFSYEHSPYYQRQFNALSIDPKHFASLDELHSLPILTKDIIRKNLSDMLSIPHRDKFWRKSTGGSTGQPLHFGYTKESYEWRVAMSMRGYSWAGAGPGTKQAYIWGAQLGKSSTFTCFKEMMHHYIDRQFYFNCFNFDEIEMAKCIKKISSFKPECIIGYTNPLYDFARYIEGNGGLDFTPKGIICAAEKVHDYQRLVMEKVFGCDVFNTYGSREFMLIASECEKHEGLHICAENLIVEIIKDDGSSAKPGEIGRIIITDLHNYGMPFIRYEIGDIGVATDMLCSCGRGLPIIGDVAGRTLDMIKTSEGKTIPGEFFPHLMKDFPDIYRFQVIQEKIDHLVIQLVPAGRISDTTKDKIKIEIRKVVGRTMNVNYQIVSDIPLNATGKHRVTICRISENTNK